MSRSQRLIIVFTAGMNGHQGASRMNNRPLQLLYEYSLRTKVGESVRYDPNVGSVDFRQMIGWPGKWDMILAFPPETSRNWAQLSKNFQRVIGYIDKSGKVVPMPTMQGGSNYRPLLADQGHEGDPRIRAREVGYPIPKPAADVVNELPVVDVKLPTHLPRASVIDFIELKQSQVADRLAREKFTKKFGYTSQIKEGQFLRADVQINVVKIAKSRYANPSRREYAAVRNSIMQYKEDFKPHYEASIHAWALVHNSKDEASDSLTWKMRIRPGTTLGNHMEYQRKGEYGTYLFNNLCKYLGWTGSKAKVAYSRELHEDAFARFNQKRAGRSEALKKASLKRAEPDFKPQLNMKNQEKLKSGEIKPASAPQGIVTMPDDYLFGAEGTGDLLLDLYLANSPEYAYFHVRKTLGDLSDWTAEHGVNATEYFESDLKSQEKHMDGAYVSLICDHLMPYFGFPENICRFHRESWLNITIGKKEIGTMTISGFLLTLLVNSIGNLARIASKYDIRRGEPCKYIGDDFLGYRHYRVRPDWAHYEKFEGAEETLTMRTDGGSFINHIEAKGFIIKDPEIMLMRLLKHEENGSLRNVIPGYFLQFLDAYRLGETPVAFLPPMASDCLNILGSFFFNLRRNTGISMKLPWNLVAPLDVDLYKRSRAQAAKEILARQAPDLLNLNVADSSTFFEEIVAYFEQ